MALKEAKSTPLVWPFLNAQFVRRMHSSSSAQSEYNALRWDVEHASAGLDSRSVLSLQGTMAQHALLMVDLDATRRGAIACDQTVADRILHVCHGIQIEQIASRWRYISTGLQTRAIIYARMTNENDVRANFCDSIIELIGCLVSHAFHIPLGEKRRLIVTEEDRILPGNLGLELRETRRKVETYLAYLSRLRDHESAAAVPLAEDEIRYALAISCIVTARNLGAWLDMILSALALE